MGKDLAVSPSLKTIGGAAYKNTKLTSVTIPPSITAIGPSAFRDNNLTVVTIPDSVASLGDFAFAGNENLNEVTLSRNLLIRTNNNAFPPSVTFKNPSGDEMEKVVYDSIITTRKDPSGTTVSRDLFIPPGITSIGFSAFRDKNITSVSIPALVISLGEYAFSGNKGIMITLSENLLRNTAENAFPPSAVFKNPSGSEMEKVPHRSIIIIEKDSSGTPISRVLSIPSTVTIIGPNAFSNKNITSAAIPSDVTAIGEGAFQNNRLTSLTIPSSVTSIGASAFRNNSLTSVSIPISVTSLGDFAFAGNTNLTAVTIIPESEQKK